MFVKICGITTPDIAAQCFELGADMIGLVYYRPSPRHVDTEQIREIVRAVAPFRHRGKLVTLVVMDSESPEVMRLLDEHANEIDCLQLHGGQQSFSSTNHNIHLIRVVRDEQKCWQLVQRHENVERNVKPDLPQYILELSHGALPGGNGKSWNWSNARSFCERFSALIAGGVSADNIGEIICESSPFGVDLSSGVESSPGGKDINKLKHFFETLGEIRKP
jgi:Phosphoribosylanthranilate isomerase